MVSNFLGDDSEKRIFLAIFHGKAGEISEKTLFSQFKFTRALMFSFRSLAIESDPPNPDLFWSSVVDSEPVITIVDKTPVVAMPRRAAVYYVVKGSIEKPGSI